MTIQRVADLPKPGFLKKFQTVEDVQEYLERLVDALQQHQSDRRRDFDILQLNNVPWVDIRSYGASVDTTDNSTAIQAANDALTSGGVIFIPAGTFDVQTAITIGNYVNIVGAGRHTAILSVTDTITTLFQYTGSDGTQNGILKDFMIDGNDNLTNAIDWNGKRYNTVERVYIKEISGTGVATGLSQIAGYENKVLDCLIQTDGIGVEIDGAGGAIRIENSTFIDNGVAAIKTYGDASLITSGHIINGCSIDFPAVGTYPNARGIWFPTVASTQSCGTSIIGTRFESMATGQLAIDVENDNFAVSSIGNVYIGSSANNPTTMIENDSGDFISINDHFLEVGTQAILFTANARRSGIINGQIDGGVLFTDNSDVANSKTNFIISGSHVVTPYIWVTKTSNYTMTARDYGCIASGEGTTITLLENSKPNTKYIVKRVDADNAITVSRETADTIDGAVSKSLDTNYAWIEVVSDGANYHIIGQGGTVS